MRKLLLASAVFLLAAWGLQGQPAYRIFTRPGLPPRDVLERLNMTIAWHARIPTDGMRDGLFSLQLVPTRGAPQLAVQTLSGMVSLLDAETGDALWRTQPGIPYWPSQPVGYNDGNIFAVRRDLLFVLNRADGQQRVFVVNKDSKLPEYGFRLEFAPSAAPVADEEMLYFSMGNRVIGYEIPEWGAAEKVLKGPVGKELSKEDKDAILEKLATLHPIRRWSYFDDAIHIEHPPLLTTEQLSVVTTSGHVLSLNKYARFLRFDFQTNSNVSAAMGQHGIIAYVGSHDFALYALNMSNERLVWRFLAGAAIQIRPEVTDNDVFVTGNKVGLFRVERSSGRQVWLNKQAERYLSNNEKFVYAADRMGRLLVLDYARGTTLASYDMRDWTLHVPNELTDRVYLASHDGQVLCLRHKDHVTPLRNKTFFEVKKKVEKKEEEEKKEEPKDAEKKDDEMGWLRPARPVPARPVIETAARIESAPRWLKRWPHVTSAAS